jgi:prepilin-type N-terminal cleavage/methylation domain-containing protein
MSMPHLEDFRQCILRSKSNMRSLTKTNFNHGFSLIELIVVIGIIGVIATIAIPAIAGIFGKSESAKVRRNAQAIVSTFNAARGAGYEASVDKAAAITAITSGAGITVGGSGPFAASVFNAPMSITESSAAAALISGLAVADTKGTLYFTR